MIPDPFAPREWTLAHGRSLTLGPVGLLMGVINLTPDSFSDGGNVSTPDQAIKISAEMASEGASIVDIGGESTRPGADEVDGDTERRRILPSIEAIAQAAMVSVDTYRADTADAAILAGAHIVNDVWGCQRDPAIAEVAATHRAGLVIMHTSREREVLPDVIDDQMAFFERSLGIATDAGVAAGQIVLDPGIGFGKDAAQNLQLLARLSELQALGFPLMLGTSRKRFLGTVADREVDHRDAATAATTALGRRDGVALFRVHAIAPNRDAIRVADAVRTGEPA